MWCYIFGNILEFHFHICTDNILGPHTHNTGIRFRGAITWNAVLSDNVNTDVSEAVHVKFLKRLIDKNVLL